MGQRLLLQDGEYGGGLGSVGFHEFHARRGVIKQLADQNGCAAWAAGRLLREDGSGLQMQADAISSALRAGQKINFGDGRNGSQCFAAETERADAGKIFFFADFACRMAEKCGMRVLRLHAAAIVRDAEEGHSSVL